MAWIENRAVHVVVCDCGFESQPHAADVAEEVRLAHEDVCSLYEEEG